MVSTFRTNTNRRRNRTGLTESRIFLGEIEERTDRKRIATNARRRLAGF
jgi:hypothetical protein